MNHAGITFQRVEDRHLTAVRFLFRKVFNKKVTLDYLRAKYATGYTGAQYLCTIAYDGDLPVGFYGALPQRFSSGGTSFLVVHACDSFTLPTYQGKGIHYRLATLAYELMQQNAVKMVYAFHSENTYHSTKKLGWLSHQRLERFHLHVTTVPIAKMAKKLGMGTWYQRYVSKCFQPIVSTNTAVFEPPGRHTQVYDTSFFNYKNGFHPHYRIELHGCHFFVKVDAVLHVGFFTFPTQEAFKLAVAALQKQCGKMGINELLFQVTPESGMSEALQSVGVPQESWLVGYLPFETLTISDFEFTYADLDTF